ncbi:MAG: hypothetical protein LKE31_01475 [Bacilli bacterium]|nr:hypothetical protein [Bacilli bacterium]
MKIISLSLGLALLIGVGYSSYVVNNDVSLLEQELNSQTITDKYVTLDYNNQTIPSAKYFLSGTESLSNIDSYSPNVDGTNHIFAGWATTNTGFDNDGVSTLVNPKTTSYSGGETLYAKYYSNSDSGYAQALNYACDVSPSSDSIQRKVYLSPTSAVAPEIVLTSTFNVYHTSSKASYSTSETGTDKTVKYPSEAGSLIVLDCDLVIDGGTFQLNCVSCTTNGGAINNVISGAFSALDLNGYNIFIRNGGKLLGYGLIYDSRNTGGIIAENGEVLSLFTPTDFAGGGYVTNTYGNGYMVFSNFIMPFLAVETVFTKDSTLMADCSLYANSAKNSSTVALIANSDAVMNLTSGYIVRRTTPYLDLIKDGTSANEADFGTYLDSRYRETFIMTNSLTGKLSSIQNALLYDYDRASVSFGSLTLTLTVKFLISITTTVSFIYTEFPVSSFFDIYLYHCDFSFQMPIVFMPGSHGYVDESSVVRFTSISGGDYRIYARLSVLDAYPGGDVIFKNGSTVISNSYIPKKTEASFSPASISMNGTFSFDSSNVSTSGNMNFYTLGGNIDLSKRALDSLLKNRPYYKLSNYKCSFTYYSVDSSYATEPSQYYNQPIISNGKVYLQESTGGEVLTGKAIADNVYQVGNDYYFYRYANASRSTTTGALSTSPDSSKINNKYDNLAGDFVKASSFSWIDEGEKAFCVSYGGSTYVNIAGAFIPITVPDSYIGTDGLIANVDLPSVCQFNLAITSLTLQSKLTFNYYVHRWRFYYA